MPERMTPSLVQEQVTAAVCSCLDAANTSSADDTARATAVAALHRLLRHPESALFLPRSCIGLARALEQLVLDKAYIVRQAAAVTYGAMGAMTTGLILSDVNNTWGPSGLFMGWALPRLTDSSYSAETTGLALGGLREFLSIGAITATENYVPSILDACEELLEHEYPLLEPLLGVLTVCGVRFSHRLEPYFIDIVDLLLGWALDPEHPEGDRRFIVDNFLKFQRMWVRNLQFPLNLLKKFLEDMETLALDNATPTQHELYRLLALSSCFVAVMQATASGMNEADPSNHRLSAADVKLPSEHVQYMQKARFLMYAWKEMLPRLISCFAILGLKFLHFRWMNEACRCLSIFAEVLKESFSDFYASAIEILFPVSDSNLGGWQQRPSLGLTLSRAFSSLSGPQIQVILEVNMRLITCQGLKLSAGAVAILLGRSSPLSSLRLHPSPFVRGTVAATYMHVVQHSSRDVVTEASQRLLRELEFLSEWRFASFQAGALSEEPLRSDSNAQSSDALFRFDLMVLLYNCVFQGAPDLKVSQARDFSDIVLDKLNPFEGPLQWNPHLQLVAWQVLRWPCIYVSAAEILPLQAPRHGLKDRTVITVEDWGESTRLSPAWQDLNVSAFTTVTGFTLVTALAMDSHSSLLVKLEALRWTRLYAIANFPAKLGARNQQIADLWNEGHTLQLNTRLTDMLLTMAFDKEPRVRAGVALAFEVILQSNLVSPRHFQPVTTVALNQLEHPESYILTLFRRLAQSYASAGLWTYGCAIPFISRQAFLSSIPQLDRLHALNGKRTALYLRSVNHLRSQQLSSILNFMSQRTQVLPLHWLQRIVCNFPGKIKSSGVTFEAEEQESTTGGRMEVFDGLGGFGDPRFEGTSTSCTLSSLWWTVQAASRHCVAVRLRTHLGGPTQTFAALERMLLDVPHLCRIGVKRRGMVLHGLANRTTVQLLPLRLLIEFVEALKKDIYNSYEGSAVLSPPPTLSFVFFRANRKVCEDWFVRIREAFISASIATQCHAGTIQSAALNLRDLRTLVPPSFRDARGQVMSGTTHINGGNIHGGVAKAMQHFSLALCRLHEADALQGVKVWVKSAFAPVLVEDYLTTPKTSTPVDPFVWLDGLTFQAKGEYEKALAQYNYILQLDEALAAMGADGIQFVIARTVESYKALADWESLDLWVQDLQLLRANHAGKTYCGALTTSGIDMNAVFALARFDGGDFHGALGYLDLTPQSRSEITADPWQALHRSEQMLLQVMLQRSTKTDSVASDIALAKAMVEECAQVAMLDGLAQASPYLIQLECIQLYDSSRNSNTPEVSSSFSPHITWPLDHVHQDSQALLKLLRVYRVVYPGSFRTLRLRQQLVRLGRKHSNLRLSRRLLSVALEVPVPADTGLDTYAELSALSGRLQYEDILLLHAEGKQDDALSKLWQLVEVKISACLDSLVLEDVNEATNAKACLKLATWLRGNLTPSSVLVVLTRSGRNGHEADFSSYEHVDSRRYPTSEILSNGKFHPIIHQIAGAAIKGAVTCSSGMAKAWFKYGYWCFTYAGGSHNPETVVTESSCTLLGLIGEEIGASNRELTLEEVARIRLIVSRVATGSSSETLNRTNSESGNDVENCVEQIVTEFSAAARSAGSEDIEGEPPVYLLSLQLQQLVQTLCPACPVAPVILELMQICWVLRCRAVSLYSYAARGFLRYLSLSNQKLTKGTFSSQVTPNREDCMLSASLYILHIIVNYGVELQDSLQQDLLSVPPSSWQAISAQILARLSSHPESRVRKQLKRLLMASANLSPWAIVYPLLVDMNRGDEVLSEELKDLRDHLIMLHPKLARDVKSMIAELSAITVFWDEQWLSTLQDLRTDVIRRITTLKHETARVSENTTLSHVEKVRINAAKYLAMMTPVIVALDRRLASTSRPPENPRESWFQNQFGSPLKRALEVFKAPPRGSSSLADVWGPFDMIAADLVCNPKKSTIPLSDVSPGLAALESSEAPMPGLGYHSSSLDRGSLNVYKEVGSSVTGCNQPDIITVASFNCHVLVLSTKTKPKKVQIVGSDGTVYPYLLKGREDLRLDARIMQLLQAVNSILLRRYETRRRALSVRHYSVTPINGRAGLIQWIESLTSLYSVYKAWQERSVVASGTNLGNGVPPVPRPSDLFYGKIIPALKGKGLRKVISRHDWPPDVKRNVLLELVKETPRQLLHKELWCASEGLSSFRCKLDLFSGSVAVISIVGYILGLGDRHLDNILVDFRSGDVVHIDYNICFDKGLRLKIPEIVPFRLTHTIQAALGLTGVEGVFRRSCDAVLQVLQCNKDVLLMLLQVFIWDPLVEWMRGDCHDEAVIGGEERKGMELAVSLSLFASRLQEIRVPLQEHHDQLLLTLPAPAIALENLVRADGRLEQVGALFSQAEQKRRAALHAESAAMSSLIEATSDRDKLQAVVSAQAQELRKTKILIVEAARKLILWVKQHASVLEALRLEAVPEYETSTQALSSPETLSLKAAISAAGAPLAVISEAALEHCEEIDQEFASLDVARQEALVFAVQNLKAYSMALQHMVPVKYVASSHVHSWAEILQVLSQDLSPDVLVVARGRAADLIAQCHGLQDDSIQQKYNEVRSRYEHEYRDLQNLRGDLADLEAVIDPEALQKSKNRFLSAVSTHLKVAQDSRSEVEEKPSKFIFVLHKYATILYNKNWGGLKRLQYQFWKLNGPSDRLDEVQPNQWLLDELIIMIDKWMLLADVVVEVGKLEAKAAGDANFAPPVWWNPRTSKAALWGVKFKACVSAVRNISQQLSGSVLPEILSSFLSHDSSVMDAYTAFTLIRENVDKLCHQDVDSRAHRSRNFVPQDGEGVKGIDHCYWEDIDFGQEEFPRRNDVSFEELEQRYNVLVGVNADSDHTRRGKVLMAGYDQLFSRLESLDQGLVSLLREVASEDHYNLLHEVDLYSTEYSVNAWKDPRMSQEKAFFIWKVRFVEGLLDTCIIATQDSSEHALQLEKRLGGRLLWFLGQYIGYRLLSLLLLCVKETHPMPVKPEECWRFEETADEEVQILRDYFNTLDSVEAANAGAASLRSQAEERLQSLDNVHVEVGQLEWQYDRVLSKLLSQTQSIGIPRSMRGDLQGANIAWWDRKFVRKNLYAASTAIRQATEGFQGKEVSGAAAEAELERALVFAWASASANLSNAGHWTGIPPEFYDHLHRRRQLLGSTYEYAVNILRICESVLEFEASRDGFLSISPGDDLQVNKEQGQMWQQTYFEVVSRLESMYISFSRTNTQLQSAVVRVESARVDFSKVASELQLASSETDSASVEVKVSVVNLQAWIKETASGLPAVSNIITSHTALTSDTGQMLDEVLAITEGTQGADDVHALAQEAAAEHACLVAKLSKVNDLILLFKPFLTSGALLSSSLAQLSPSGMTLTDGLVERSSGYGHNAAGASHSSLKETSAALTETITTLLSAVKNLHSCLIKLIQTAFLHAGFLHKALAGVGGGIQGEAVTAKSDTREQLGVENPDFENSDASWISPPESGQAVSYADTFSARSSIEISEEQKVLLDGEGYQTLPDTRDAPNLVDSTEGDEPSSQLSIPPVSSATTTLISSQQSGFNASSDIEPLPCAFDIKWERGIGASSEDLLGLSHPIESKICGADTAPRGQPFKGKNAYAVSVLKRVQIKLEGRESDGSCKHGAVEQVDILLRQATGIDNLANMYEGWTPWV